MSDLQHHPDPRTTPPDALTATLWVVLVISVVGNSVTSFAGLGVGVNLALGALTLLCIGLLVARRLGRSR